MPSSRTALWVWYRGDAFRGYQTQPVGPTVQQTLSHALCGIGVERTPSPSGRTDRGVHARMQVASVRVPDDVAPEHVRGAIDQANAAALGCAAICRAAPSFHAQWSAVGKEYRYRLALGAIPDPKWAPFAWTPSLHPRLEGRVVRAEDVADILSEALGERDFGAFHESSSPRKLRRLYRACVRARAEGLHEVTLVGSGFGRYQVRYLVGSAVAVAAGVLPLSDWRAALASATPMAGLKAEACGLVLWNVLYPDEVDPFKDERQRVEASLPFWAREAHTEKPKEDVSR